MATKRVKRKEATRNNPQCLTESTNPDERDEDGLLSKITLELKVAILSRLRAKDVVKFMGVSNLWSSTIRTKDFTEMYMARSSTRPRLLFAGYGNDKQFFHSCSEKDLFSDHHRVNMTPNPRYQPSSPPINGLMICCQNDKRVLMIGNPSTGQFITLPKVKTGRKDVVSYLGYDPVDNLHKVLSMTVSLVQLDSMSEQHQVLSIGAKQKWRKINCNVPHYPYSTGTNGICMNGVVYYLGSSSSSMPLIISFDLRSEEFNATELPGYIGLPEHCKLLNHTGKIAVATPTYKEKLNLWVLEDVSRQKWSKTSFLIPSWTCRVDGRNDRVCTGEDGLWFRGTLSTGEIIYAPQAFVKPFFLFCYDPEQNNSRKVVIEEIGDEVADVQVFLNHIESPMLLPKVK